MLKALRRWSENSGVRIQLTAVASSHQNGAIEPSIQTAEANMRALLKDADLPLGLWDEVVEANIYMTIKLQEGPTFDSKQIGPEQAFTGVFQILIILEFEALSVSAILIPKKSHCASGKIN